MRGIHASPGKLAPILWLLLIAFVGRVVGQALVAFADVGWLPPMEAWMSGLLGYPYLLASQVVIVAVYARVCIDFSRGRGWAVQPRSFMARGVLYFGCVYFAGMILRYVLQMVFRPETRWLGGTIPIFFHLALATFLILVGLWHRARIERPATAGSASQD